MAHKECYEFTPEMIARHNAVPAGNARKSSGMDRGKYVDHSHPVAGQGEYDTPVMPKESGN